MSTVDPGSYPPPSNQPPQSPYPQYASTQYSTVGAAPRRGNGWGLAALIVGIVAVVFAAVPFLCFLAFLVAIAAIVLGIVGLVVKHRPRGTAIWGLVLGAVAIVLATVMSVVSVGIIQGIARNVGSIASEFPSAFPSDFPTEFGEPSDGTTGDPGLGDVFELAPGDHEVTYEVTGGGEATVAYNAYAGGQSGANRDTFDLPFDDTQTFSTTADDAYASFSLTAVQTTAEEPVTCTISVDGEVVSTRTSDSPYAVVICFARTET